MAMLLTYFNNEKPLVEAVLLISTYGVRFVQEENTYNLPCYRILHVF